MCIRDSGYEIITELNNSASILGYAKEGTIYPILYRLQEAELIQCRLAPAAANGGSKKYNSLTHKGREVLDELILFSACTYNLYVGIFLAYSLDERRQTLEVRLFPLLVAHCYIFQHRKSYKGRSSAFREHT